MNTEKFESFFESPKLAEYFINELSEIFSNITFGGDVKIGQVQRFTGSIALTLPKFKGMDRRGYWCSVNKMSKITVD